MKFNSLSHSHWRELQAWLWWWCRVDPRWKWSDVRTRKRCWSSVQAMLVRAHCWYLSPQQHSSLHFQLCSLSLSVLRQVCCCGPRRQEMLIDYWFVHVTELCCDNYLHNNTRVCIFSSVWNLLPTTDCHLLYHLEGGAKNYTSVT